MQGSNGGFMKCIHLALLSSLFLGEIIPQDLLSNIVVIENSSGSSVEIGINENDRFLDVLDQIQNYFQQDTVANDERSNAAFGNSNHPSWNLAVSHAGLIVRAKQGIKRDYQAGFTREQKEDITFLVTTLAWGNAIELAKKNGELKAIKPRIVNVHPLNFLYIIFSNEKLIAGIAAIKERKIPSLKSTFFGELKASLEEEGDRNNLLPFVEDFANKLDISKKKIFPLLENRSYDEFVDMLIELKPREGANRHNM